MEEIYRLLGVKGWVVFFSNDYRQTTDDYELYT